MQALHINGNTLTLDDFREVVYERRSVLLAPDARLAVSRARAVVEDLLEHDRVAYAVNTGVGKLADVRISPQDIVALQVKLLRSHAVGVGEPLPQDVVRAMILLRANSLAKGHSGVRDVVIDKLCELLNRGVHPVVPSQGSVGASGDLAPLSHLALVLIGEGAADFEGRQLSAAEALRRAGIEPLVLQAKETISLINGTQAMLAVGLIAVLRTQILADSADVIAGLTVDAQKGTHVAFDERIHKVRPHPGQIMVADHLRLMLADSEIRESHRDCGKVQDAYSLRCIPQVHGAVRDTLTHCRGVFEIEMNSAV
ncbi:MAG: aromatic amino acid lyase, partial [Deltaproteobacteria bacterium]|nr:aromatic amino acid lyase [Deltaproteobacteria bacterium]